MSAQMSPTIRPAQPRRCKGEILRFCYLVGQLVLVIRPAGKLGGEQRAGPFDPGEHARGEFAALNRSGAK